LCGRFAFHHHDLCLFHQSICNEIDARRNSLSQYIDKHQKILSADIDVSDELAWVSKSRIRDVVIAHEMEAQNIKVFGDQLLVVGLWAMVERYCGRTLIEAEHRLLNRRQDLPSPHQWPVLAKRFRDVGLDLVTCKSHAGADECRVLNNKIKHVGHVDKELARFQRFEGRLGKYIDQVPIDLQHYVDSTYEFIGCVMEKTADLIETPDNESPSERPDSL
jgi:hypothetical protein